MTKVMKPPLGKAGAIQHTMKLLCHGSAIEHGADWSRKDQVAAAPLLASAPSLKLLTIKVIA